MPALRQPVKRRPRFWISLGAAALLAAVALVDWARPASAQLSVRYYDQGVFTIYGGYVRPITSRFVHCRYQPTCSVYSIVAMQTYGFPKGLWLTAKRLSRCLPWVPLGTLDPVPLPSQNAHGLAPLEPRIPSMDSSTKDKIKGKVDQAKGAVKEKAGEAVGNPDLQDRGTAQKVGGKIQEKVGDIKKVFEK